MVDLTLTLFLLVSAPSGATITGTVRDAESGAALAGANVSLPDLDRGTVTDSAGAYALERVPAGPHHLAVQRLGYRPRTLHALVPRAGVLEIHISLPAAPLRLEGVRVRAPLPVRGVEGGQSADLPDRRVSAGAVANHPLLAEPDVLHALGGGEVVLRPETSGGVHVRGGASDQTAYLLDGIPVFSPYHGAGVSSAWNPDAIAALELSSTADPFHGAHALSGIIEGATRRPGTRWRSRGAASTTQARLTVDGPLGGRGAGCLFALRSGAHEVLAPGDESSYLSGGTGDWMAKVETPFGGGRLQALALGNDDAVSAAAQAPTAAPGPRNRFDWSSRSLGAAWRRAFGDRALHVLGWRATGDAGAGWAGPFAPVTLVSTRRDWGLETGLTTPDGSGSTRLEARLEHSRTRYQTRADTAAAPVRAFGARTPLFSLMAERTQDFGPLWTARLASSLTLAQERVHPGAQARVSWTPVSRVTVTTGYARTHQFAQSLRNSESVVGHIFPVDLFVGAGDPEVPVAHGDLILGAVDLRPFPGARLGVQVYARRSDGLVLVAPREGGPFATAGFAVGSASSHGVTAEAALRSARFGVLASYGWQRLRYRHGDSAYTPEHGAEHLLQGGVLVFPAATLSLRLGAAASFGRRATVVPAGLEWESCNLLDQGCEFAGSPDYTGEPLGRAALPPYVRLDLGLRRHWDVVLGGREGMIAVHGTFTNLLGRKNLLTYARDPVTSQRVGIELRPPALLVVGIDWLF